MARGVKSSLWSPTKPVLLERRIYTTRPATTGGRLIKVLRILTTRPLPGKVFRLIRAPRGMPSKAAKTRAVPVTLRDRKIMP